MSKVLQIFRRDLRRILRNPVAIVVTLGVALIPSLYAWFNILANWDPYKNTSDIKIAVVDEDKGANIEDLGNINAGNLIVEKLQDNDQLGWTFVDKDQALEGVRSGEYYAAIVIPSDFTSSLSDVLDGDTEKAHIGYYVNEKANAVSPKVTDTGASTLESQVTTEFVKVCGTTVSEKLQGGVSDAAKDINKAVKGLSADLKDIGSVIGGLADGLEDAKGTVADARSSVSEARKTLSDLKGATADVSTSLSNALDTLGTTRKKSQGLAAELTAALGNGTRQVASISAQANYDIGELTGDLGWAQGKVDAAISQLDAANNGLYSIVQNLTDVRDHLAGLELDDATAAAARDKVVAQLDEQIAAVTTVIDAQADKISHLRKISDDVKNGLTSANEAASAVNSAIQGGADSLGSLQDTFVSTTMPALSSSLDTFADVGGRLVGATSSVAPMLEQADGTLGQLDQILAQCSSTFETTADSLRSAADKVNSLASDVDAVRSAENFAGIKEILGLDPEQVGEFIGSPVVMETKAICPVENYGSGVAPFYTNLALWVGGFVLVAIYKLEVDEEEVGSFKPWQGYLGRWMLLNAVGLLQAVICCVGDLVLGIQCLSPAAFIFAGLVQSFVYVNFIYALSIAFKHIGKALGVLIVVLQIPGAAGLYPIEMMPGFFQALHPLLPFTYGINAMREAIAGFYGDYYAFNIAVLLVYLIPSLLIGLGARRHLLNINALFDRKLGETDLMITERVAMESPRFKLATIVKALADSEGYKKAFTERAASFELAYPVLVKRGFYALVWVPLVLLALMFVLPMKMLMLTVWVISLLVICTALIVIEYMHDRVSEKTKMADMSRDELFELLGDGLKEEYFAFAPLDKIRMSEDSPLRKFAAGREGITSSIGKAIKSAKADASGVIGTTEELRVSLENDGRTLVVTDTATPAEKNVEPEPTPAAETDPTPDATPDPTDDPAAKKNVEPDTDTDAPKGGDRS